jgi:hypothetical protein
MINPEECWKNYWDRLKGYIENNQPVSTNIDFTIFPYYVELRNLSGEAYHYSHNIVIVGIDEEQGLVYYHDPLCEALTCREDGYYATVSIEDLKKCVQSIHWLFKNGWEEGYVTLTFKQIAEPLSPEERIIWAFERNIERMKGDPDAYDKQSARENFQVFGIKALHAMKKDFSHPLTPYIMLIYPYKRSLYNSCFLTQLEKHNVSQYLMSQQHLSDLIQSNAELLFNEAVEWCTLLSHLEELHDTSLDVFSLKKCVDNIIITLDMIISIEEQIINES